MDKYRNLIKDFSGSMMLRSKEKVGKQYMIMVGSQEFGEMMSLCNNSSAEMSDGKFDGKFYGLDIKRLPTQSAFTIIKKQDYTEMIKLIKTEMISVMPRVRLVAEID